jgi:hypothetical protein
LIWIPISIWKDVTMLFTLVSALIWLYLLFKKGTIGINKYGSDPLAIGADLSEDEKKKIAESYLQENSTPSANL